MEHGREKMLQRGAAVKAWLELLGSCPLSLSVISESTEDPREQEESLLAVRYFLLAVINFSTCWKDVDFAIPFFVYQEYLSHLDKADVPALEKILLLFLYEDFPELLAVQTSWHPGPMFPSLRHITLFLQDHTPSESDFGLHWEPVTHLLLAGNPLSLTRALEILIQCSKLISCKMEITPPMERASLTITLPFLCSLEFA
jgi:hypothetical protein